jgi:hypothetical protein
MRSFCVLDTGRKSAHWPDADAIAALGPFGVRRSDYVEPHSFPMSINKLPASCLRMKSACWALMRGRHVPDGREARRSFPLAARQKKRLI